MHFMLDKLLSWHTVSMYDSEQVHMMVVDCPEMSTGGKAMPVTFSVLDDMEVMKTGSSFQVWLMRRTYNED